MTIDDLQALIDKMYSDKDRERGTPATFLWLSEEFGELAAALREGSQEQKRPSLPTSLHGSSPSPISMRSI